MLSLSMRFGDTQGSLDKVKQSHRCARHGFKARSTQMRSRRHVVSHVPTTPDLVLGVRSSVVWAPKRGQLLVLAGDLGSGDRNNSSLLRRVVHQESLVQELAPSR